MLSAYIAHAERFGPECVLETAARELDTPDLAQLKGFVDAKERVYRYHGGSWVPKRVQGRVVCDWCQLDLPPGVKKSTKYHAHCRKAAFRARNAASVAA